MKVAHIVGARPQFIKMAVISRAIMEHNQRADLDESIKEIIIHTGQHYDYEMSRIFFEELHIPRPDYNLDVGSGTHGIQTGEILKRAEQVLLEEEPDVVLVYGDTNSTLAGALAAVKLHIPVAHVEAGIRGFSKRIPEEINRVVTDHVSTILFCPTETAVRNLQREGFTNVINDGRLVSTEDVKNFRFCIDNALVINVGDVMYDSVLYNLRVAESKSAILQELGLEAKAFYLATVHRAENTDNPERLKEILSAFESLAERGMKVICPLHPRTRKALQTLERRERHPGLRLIEPISYLDMLVLEKNARVILTDSGGVQKEAFILRTPCITLHKGKEWAETVEAGWNILAGASRVDILKAVEHFRISSPSDPQVSPYGNGDAGKKIVKIILNHIERI